MRTFYLIFLIVLFSILASAQASLPQNWVNNLEYVGTTTNTINFPASGTGGSWSCGVTNYGPYTANSATSFQQAINDAESCRTANGSGTTILLPPGALFSNSSGFTFPQTATDTSTNFIILNSSSPLPSGQTACSHGIQDNLSVSTQPGIRNLGCNGTSMSYQLATTITPVSGAFTLANGTVTNTSNYNDLSHLWTAQCTGVNCQLFTTAAPDVNGVAPHHYAILNAEARPQVGVTGFSYMFSIGTSNETATSQLPNHFHIAYSYIHGDWTDAPVSGGVATGPPTGANSISTDVRFGGCINCSFMYNYIDRSLRPGAEGHGIGMQLAHQIKIAHNWIEGQAIGLLCGGVSTTIAFSGFITCQDIEDRGNRYTYPYSWLLAANAGFKPNGGTNSFGRKNSHEQKSSQRYLNDGNIYENVDGTGGQQGNIGGIWSVPCSGGGTCVNYQTVQNDSTFTNALIRNACKGFFTLNGTAGGTSAGGIANSPQRELWQNILQYNIGPASVGCASIGSPYWGLRPVGLQGTANQWPATVLRDGSGLTTTISLQPGVASDVNVGDPVQISGCSDTSFNTVLTAMGPPALAGTNPTGLTVVYSNPGTPNAGSGVTGCKYHAFQGFPQFITFNHSSQFMGWTINGGDPYIGGDTSSTAPLPLQRHMTFTNNILLSPGFSGVFGEGTRTETQGLDPATELVHHLLLPGRDAAAACSGHSAGSGGIAACYSEYDTVGGAAITPTTIYGPPGFCTTNDPVVENCAGIVGAMSQSSFPINLSDWHLYRLCQITDAGCNHKASIYAAGQSRQASDSVDMGVNVSAIDSAQTSIQYICSTSCGSPGPFPDVATNISTTIPSTLFGLHWNIANPYPTVPFGTFRLFGPGHDWQQTNTSNGVYTFTTIDSYLASAKTHGLTDVMLELGITPNWISSDPTNSSCAGAGFANGGCGVPTDIAASCTNANGLHNCDGKTDGTNQAWRNYIYNLGTHVAGLSSSTYQKITSMEVWNEFTTVAFWEGTQAQLLKLAQDANCILTGRGTGCTAGAMNVAAVNVLPGVTVATPSAVMTSPDSTAWGTYVAQAGALDAADVADVHAYTQGGGCCALPETVITRYNTAQTKLTAAGGTQPLWSSEGGYGQQSPAEPDLDLQAAFIARYYLLGWSSGFQRLYWYAWDNPSWGTLWNPNTVNGCNDGGSGLGCTTKGGIAYGQAYSLMVGSVMTSPCAVISGTLWSCTLQKSGTTYLVMWDTSKTCASGSCTTANQTVSSVWAFYQDMTSVSTPTIIVSNTVPVGAKPVILSPAGTLAPPTGLQGVITILGNAVIQ